ncbi:hypothetical protein GCM10009624_25990 [Gordonia sinesedis]
MKKPLGVALGLAAAASLAATTLITGGTASAAEPASLTIQGDLHLTPTLRLLRIDAQGVRDKDGKTTGTYVATMLDGMNPTPIQVRGPITCISSSGNAASLVYPISEVRPFGMIPALKDKYAIQISVRKGTDGRSSRVGVNGPMPTGNFTGCAPAATPFAFKGTIETTGG